MATDILTPAESLVELVKDIYAGKHILGEPVRFVGGKSEVSLWIKNDGYLTFYSVYDRMCATEIPVVFISPNTFRFGAFSFGDLNFKTVQYTSAERFDENGAVAIKGLTSYAYVFEFELYTKEEFINVRKINKAYANEYMFNPSASSRDFEDNNSLEIVKYPYEKRLMNAIFYIPTEEVVSSYIAFTLFAASESILNTCHSAYAVDIVRLNRIDYKNYHEVCSKQLEEMKLVKPVTIAMYNESLLDSLVFEMCRSKTCNRERVLRMTLRKLENVYDEYRSRGLPPAKMYGTEQFKVNYRLQPLHLAGLDYRDVIAVDNLWKWSYPDADSYYFKAVEYLKRRGYVIDKYLSEAVKESINRVLK